MIKLSASEPRDNCFAAIRDAVMTCLGFALVCCSVGALREILASQTIWDKPFELYSIKLIGVEMPFFGFIMIGFVSALFRSIDRTALRAIISAPSYEPKKKAVKESVGDKG